MVRGRYSFKYLRTNRGLTRTAAAVRVRAQTERQRETERKRLWVRALVARGEDVRAEIEKANITIRHTPTKGVREERPTT